MIKTKKPKKQRQRIVKRIAMKGIGSHLSKSLIEKYKIRTAKLRVGDEVKIIRGIFKGKQGRVEKVIPKKEKVFIEGIEIEKQDGTKAKVPVHNSNLIITSLKLDDKMRKEKIERKIKKVKANEKA